MSSIPILPNDTSLQNLRIDNQAPSNAAQVSAIAASRGVTQTTRPRTQRGTRNRSERRHGKRRKTERRRRRLPVLLDTRSNHDRRTHLSQRGADLDESGTSATVRGIDTTI